MDPVARIEAELKRRKWTKVELARRAGFKTPSQLGNILSNLKRDPGAIQGNTAKKIADALGIDVAAIFGADASSPASAAPAASAPLTPPDVVVERGEVMSALENALFRVMDREKYDTVDFDETRTALRTHAFLLQELSDEQALRAALLWLDAAYQLRIHGQPVTPSTIAARAAIGKTKEEHQREAARAAAVNAEAEDQLRELGQEPPSAERQNELLERMKTSAKKGSNKQSS